MTPEEQDRLIIGMVKERNALRRERGLLEEQVTQTRNGMRDAISAANLASQGTYTALEEGFTYQGADTFTGTLRRLQAIEARFAELTERLNAC